MKRDSGADARREIPVVGTYERAGQIELVVGDIPIRKGLEHRKDQSLASTLDHDLAGTEAGARGSLIHLFEEAEPVVAKAQVQRELRSEFPVVLNEAGEIGFRHKSAGGPD